MHMQGKRVAERKKVSCAHMAPPLTCDCMQATAPAAAYPRVSSSQLWLHIHSNAMVKAICSKRHVLYCTLNWLVPFAPGLLVRLAVPSKATHQAGRRRHLACRQPLSEGHLADPAAVPNVSVCVHAGLYVRVCVCHVPCARSRACSCFGRKRGGAGAGAAGRTRRAVS